jgi:hypothetical protein
MFKKIVFLTSANREVNSLVLDLAKQPQSRLVLLALIEPKSITQISQTSGRKESAVREELENIAWQEIYHLENDFKKFGVKVTLFLKETSLFDIQSFLRSTKADLFILPVARLKNHNYKLTEEFITELSCPVLLVGKP